jgi:ribosomal protein S18 acetylase RimI-like enzyme
MNTIIRTATSNDIEQLVLLLIALDELHVKMYPTIFDSSKIKDNIRKSFLLNNIDKPDNLFLLAESERKSIGIVHCYIQETKNHPIKKDKKVAVLSDLYVEENYRNKGIAQQLINKALETIKENWLVKDVVLKVFNENQEAIKIYEKSGFQKQFINYSIAI